MISIQDTGLAAGASSQAGGWGFSWDAVGRLATRIDPNGIRRSATFLTEGWVDDLRLTYPDGTSQLVDYSSYDDFGSPGTIDYGGGEITNPAYDAASRLDTVSIPPFAGNEQFDVDADGNRTRYWQGGDNRRLLLDAAHQLYRTERFSNGVRLESFTHDGAGRRETYNEWDEVSGAVPANQLLDRSTTYSYDGLGRLSAVTRTGGYAMTLDYGPLGERIRRTEVASTGAPSVTSLYLGGLVELRDIGASGVAQTAVRLVAGPGPAGFVGEVTAAGELRSLLGDAGHNVIRAAVIAGAGPYTKSVYSRRYRAFGQAGFASGTVLVERGFAGQVPEGQSGVVYMNARHYDPAHGRFLQPDPLGVQSDQLYAYAANNPFAYVDPSGMSPVSLSAGFDFSSFGSAPGGSLGGFDFGSSPSQGQRARTDLGFLGSVTQGGSFSQEGRDVFELTLSTGPQVGVRLRAGAVGVSAQLGREETFLNFTQGQRQLDTERDFVDIGVSVLNRRGLSLGLTAERTIPAGLNDAERADAIAAVPVLGAAGLIVLGHTFGYEFPGGNPSDAFMIQLDVRAIIGISAGINISEAIDLVNPGP